MRRLLVFAAFSALASLAAGPNASAAGPLRGMSGRSEVRLNAEAGGPASVPIMTWRDIPFRTIVRQRFDFSCGSAAVATLLTYHYRMPTTEEQAFSAMWSLGNQAAIRRKGFSLLDMKNYLISRGLNAQGYRITLDQLKAAQIPLIVLIEVRGFRHFAVVKGARDDRILLGDPIRGLLNVPSADFARIWSGIVLAIAPSGNTPAPAFNQDSDWRKWATAPIDSRMVDRSIEEMTSNFPPIYQITPVYPSGLSAGIQP